MTRDRVTPSTRSGPPVTDGVRPPGAADVEQMVANHPLWVPGRGSPAVPFGPRLSLPGHAALPPLLHHAPRRSGRRRDGVPPAARPGGLRPPARIGHLLAPPAGQAGQS